MEDQNNELKLQSKTVEKQSVPNNATKITPTKENVFSSKHRTVGQWRIGETLGSGSFSWSVNLLHICIIHIWCRI